MNIDEIVKKGEKINLTNIHPTLSEMNKMNKIVESYIKKNKLIIYGGTAIIILLKSKGINLVDKDKFLDYDFYSPNFIRDSVAIANQLYDKGYKYVRRINAIHPDTVRVGAEFASEFLADITFVPEKVYKKIPTKTIFGFLYADPQFLKVDLYRSMCQPNMNLYRWTKVYPRLAHIEKSFPLKQMKNIPKSFESPKELYEFGPAILEILQDPNENIIATGIMAFNLFMSVADKNAKSVPVLIYEIFSSEPKKLADKIINKIPGATFKKYYPYLELLPEKVTIFLNDTPIVDIYNSGFECIPLREINRIKLTNLHRLLEFLYAKYNILIIENKKDNIYNYIIPLLLQTAAEYNKKNNLDGTEVDNPFRIFQTDCFSTDYDALRLEPIKNMFYGKANYPGYKPEKHYLDPSEISIPYNNNFLGEEITGKKESTLHDSILESIEDELIDIKNKNKNTSTGILTKRKSRKISKLGGSKRRSVSFARRLTKTRYF